MADNGTEEKWAVVLVHGIGLTNPLAIIEQVTDALREPSACPLLELDGPSHAYKRTEEFQTALTGQGRRAAMEARKDEHRLYTQHARYPGGRVRFATAHWSDISFYREGLLNLIGAVMIASFGVRFFAKAASSQTTIVSRAMNKVLDWMVGIVAVVAFPVTFVSMIYAIMALIFEYSFKYELVAYQASAIVAGGMLVCLVIAWAGRTRVWEMREDRTLGLPIFNSIAIIAVLVGMLISIGYSIDNTYKFEDAPVRGFLAQLITFKGQELIGSHWVARALALDRIGIYFGFLHWLQVCTAVVLIALTAVTLVLLAFNVPHSRLYRGRGRSLVLATVAVISIWIVNLIVLWPENLATAGAMSSYSRLSSADRPKAVPTIEISSWRLRFVETPLAAQERQAAAPGVALSRERTLADYYPLLWFEAAFLVFVFTIAVVSVVLVALRKVWARVYANPNFERFKPRGGQSHPARRNWPRLIVTPLYILFVLVLMSVVSVIGAAQLGGFDGWLARVVGIAYPGDKLPHEMAVPSELVRVLVILFVTGFLFLSHYIRDGVKLILDVVNHFTGPLRGFPVRKRIASRVEEAIAFQLRDGDKPNLVILAHSQGTILAIDALMTGGLWGRIKDQVSSLTVLTFGSPITHVYQRYFSLQYPDFEKIESMKALAAEPRVKWFNVYRIDDYVGTYVENTLPDFPVNVPCKPGGHTAYWRTDVFQRLFAEPAMAGFMAGAQAKSARPVV